MNKKHKPWVFTFKFFILCKKNYHLFKNNFQDLISNMVFKTLSCRDISKGPELTPCEEAFSATKLLIIAKSIRLLRKQVRMYYSPYTLKFKIN